MKRLLAVGCALMVAGVAQATSIALNFWGGASDLALMGKSETGGGVLGSQQANWNNFGADGNYGGNAALSTPIAQEAWLGNGNLVDNTGASTTIDFGFTNPDPSIWGPYGAADQWGVDATRGSGYDTSSAGIGFSSIPWATYTVFVWRGGVDTPDVYADQTGATWGIYQGGETPAVAAVQIWNQVANSGGGGGGDVPEPGTVLLLGGSLLGLCVGGFRRFARK